jgi:deoxycytidine triphosphate deaminase
MPSLAKKRQEVLDRIKASPPFEYDPHPDVQGVLLSDEIRFYAKHCRLLKPFDQRNLKPAGYELTIGDEYFLAGEFKTLRSDGGGRRARIVIPPFEVAVIKTTEFLCLPRYMIARWNIRVRHAYSGLLWVGGPQVDPGYVGHLFCPLYNLSDKPVILYQDDQIAVIDFVKTSRFDRHDRTEKTVRYNFPPSRWILEDFNIDSLRSGLFATVGTKLIEVEDDIRSIGIRFSTYTQMSFAIFALVISSIAILSRANFENIAFGSAFWGSATISIALGSILFAIFSYLNSRVGSLFYKRYSLFMGQAPIFARRYLRRMWWLGLCICLGLASIGGWELYRVTEPQFEEFRRQQLTSQADIQDLRSSMSSTLDKLSNRVNGIELNRSATIDDLNQLKRSLEQELQSAKGMPNTETQTKTEINRH